MLCCFFIAAVTDIILGVFMLRLIPGNAADMRSCFVPPLRRVVRFVVLYHTTRRFTGTVGERRACDCHVLSVLGGKRADDVSAMLACVRDESRCWSCAVIDSAVTALRGSWSHLLRRACQGGGCYKPAVAHFAQSTRLSRWWVQRARWLYIAL